ncbi:MAG: hypothetical protein A3C80_01170 [Candidatus Ryanbacteria bacterium RIFCSPHIGHO2_02_FULL_45_43]|uniref:Transport permease protein n=1 Tax=Candidatus Ryanbacteria bacterium RIFCSPHIGHO2_01_45_13 TaxID=1802112 RepID=A0A1G2FZ37_9BACT|nr:MAG: hypothetical protein A2718_03400 [Candidatus Ryanbacteria bacterium RIFCSPHIGHO2_01_FULL_44_130]OGZ42870.1 MAG: hypothetical protein A2W41_01975 [Candidatus Ryanbacteria bacterium RIFCSPHIGHO2_01_45_13]OGZ48136.1 MAG: hypothetical protein A3C80_01170 [Candidatus Ryanbacteria bacterium RIFCSPHIGHO2_02_FULL_45_43]OGZ49784.1 MAG: hypothetical protein A3E55_00995 [Candidatus Ryanbacteria bacterium RIFCSPHIGHO2_12_FULL_44_20]OGZ51210.1 MAG: hypothetical protein A3A17_04205 [Candidatus Ryanba
MNVNWIGLGTFVLKEINRMFRVVLQTLISPWISAVLYILIFGKVIGSRIDLIAGVKYIDFVLPGILMMNIISSSFTQVSSSLYFQRFARHIEEILVAPFSYLEMIVAYVVGGVVRGLIVGLGVYIIAIFFTEASIEHFWIFLFYAFSVSMVFSLLGLLVGLWADGFEQLNVLNIFVILPLSFLGGVFNSIYMLPEGAQTFARLNPFFYFIDGLRYSMVGISEANTIIGLFIIFISIAGLGALGWYLFKIGYKIRS